jgi:hypothetical protein
MLLLDRGNQMRLAGHDSCADRRREKHRHPLGLALVPRGDQMIGILKNLLFGPAARRCFILGLLRRASSILRLLKPMRGFRCGAASVKPLYIAGHARKPPLPAALVDTTES